MIGDVGSVTRLPDPPEDPRCTVGGLSLIDGLVIEEHHGSNVLVHAVTCLELQRASDVDVMTHHGNIQITGR